MSSSSPISMSAEAANATTPHGRRLEGRKGRLTFGDAMLAGRQIVCAVEP